ncbi:hypothetical protein MCHI_003715 [Candidatus Magnetoovum chiemensis]|nr:hypothetical protein MCHI_003715 [Candidatus Magnetoovum chiemensis]
MYKIAVIDGQGGGIGSAVVKRIREAFGEGVEITALGTNSWATSTMLKAKANKGATGQNAVVFNADKVDLIIGPLSIVVANSMLGELTPIMSEAISISRAEKLLLPLNQEGIEVVGVEKEPLPHLIERLIERIKEKMEVQ